MSIKLQIQFHDNNISDSNAVNALYDIKKRLNSVSYKEIVRNLIFEKHKKIKRKDG